MASCSPNARCLSLSVLLLAALGGDLAGAEDPAPAPVTTVHYSDVSARLAVKDAPLWLHLRIEADGRFALRSAAEAEAVSWTDRGVWRFTGTAEADVEALRGLQAGLANALGPEPRPAGMVDDDKHSRARLLIDTHADAPWRHVQWALAIACAPKLMVWKLTFLVPEAATWVDVDLPKDRGAGRIVDELARRVRSFVVKIFRKGLEEPTGAQFTRLRVEVRVRDLSETGVPKGEARLPEPKVLTGGGDGSSDRESTIDLPPGGAPSDARRAAWSRFSAELAAAVVELPVQGEIKTPPPTGGATPCADVVEVLVRLRQAGCPTVLLEGAPPPMPRRR